MISAGPITNPGDFVVELRDEHGVLLPDAFVTGAQKGMEITYTLINTSTGNSCWGVLRAEDKIAPVVAGCQSGEITLAPTSCFSFSAFDIAMSTLITDNCDPNPSVIILDDFVESDLCVGNILQTLVRDIIAIDNCDNESPRCRIIIPITRLDLTLENGTGTGIVPPADTIVKCEQIDPVLFPENIDFLGNPDPVQLSGVPYFQVNSGSSIPLLPIDDMSFCELSIVFADSVLVLDRCFTKIIRHWTIIENCPFSPQELNFIQNITIMDMEAPTITGVPTKLNFNTNTASPEVCAAITPVPVPVLADNCQDPDDLTLFVIINGMLPMIEYTGQALTCLLYTSPSPRDATLSRMPSSA